MAFFKKTINILSKLLIAVYFFGGLAMLYDASTKWVWGIGESYTGMIMTGIALIILLVRGMIMLADDKFFLFIIDSIITVILSTLLIAGWIWLTTPLVFPDSQSCLDDTFIEVANRPEIEQDKILLLLWNQQRSDSSKFLNYAEIMSTSLNPDFDKGFHLIDNRSNKCSWLPSLTPQTKECKGEDFEYSVLVNKDTLGIVWLTPDSIAKYPSYQKDIDLLLKRLCAK